MTLLEELRFDFPPDQPMHPAIRRAIAAIEHLERAPLPSAWPDALDEPLPYAGWYERAMELLK